MGSLFWTIPMAGDHPRGSRAPFTYDPLWTYYGVLGKPRGMARSVDAVVNGMLPSWKTYLAMSEEARAGGDGAQAKVYREMAESIDSGAAKRLPGGAAATTRGSGETVTARK